MVLQKTLQSPWHSKEIQPVHPKRNQPWIFIGRTDAETPILWPPDEKNWFNGKDLDAGKGWRQEEKGVTEDEMVGWHHQFNGHECEHAPGVGDGQGSLACCNPWGHKESGTTEWLKDNNIYFTYGNHMFTHYCIFPPPSLSPTVSTSVFSTSGGQILNHWASREALGLRSKCRRTNCFGNPCWRQRWSYFKRLMWSATALLEADMSDCPVSLLTVQNGRVTIINDKFQVDGKQKQVESMALQWEDQRSSKQL